MKRLAAAALLFALALLGAPSESLAQTVKVIGAVTPGHCVSFFSTTQIQDAGGVCGGGGGGGISGPGISTIGHLAVWSNNTGTAIADTNLSFAGGFSFVGTLTGATNVTFPTSGTLATTANANVASVTGTTGQITASPTTGGVVLSLPTTITQSETFSGTVNHTGPFQINGTPLTLPVSLTNGGTNNGALVASAGGIVWSDASKLNVLAGTSTAGQCLLSGNLAAPTWGTCPGGAGVTSVANFAADTSLTLSGSGGGPPWIGAVTIKLNLANAQTWTAAQTFSGTVNVTGGFQINGTPLTLPVTLANGGTNAVLVASAGGVVWSDATKLNILAGTSTAGQCLLSGNLATPTWGSCTGGAAVSSVTAADTSLTVSPTTGAVTTKVNLANAFVWTNPHKWVGAGTQILISNNAAATAATNQGIDVIEDAVPVSLNLISYGVNGTVNMPTFVGATARGSFASPLPVQANDVLASFSGRGYTGSGFATVGRGFVRFFASETWGSGANGTYISFATTPSGTLATTEALRIENDGGLTVPTTVTGGSKGNGTINTGALYIGGVQLALPVSLANGGTNNSLTASAGGVVWSDASKLNILAGTSTAGQCLLSGNLAAPTWGSCAGAGVTSVTNSDGTLTISPTTGAVVASLALGHANTWTAVQTFTNSDIALLGSSTGATTFASANSTASAFTLTFPAATDQLVARATTDTLTNKTYDTAGTGNVFKINGTQITAISGNTATVGSTSGAFVSGNCVKTDVNHNLVDNGAACGGGGGTPGGSTGQIQYNNAGAFGGFGFWNGSATTSLGNGATAQQFIVYNTVDTISAPTNYERGVFDWTTNANALTIAMQKGGTGTGRKIIFTAFPPSSDSSVQFNIPEDATIGSRVFFNDTTGSASNIGFTYLVIGNKKWSTAAVANGGTFMDYQFFNEQTGSNGFYVNGDTNALVIQNTNVIGWPGSGVRVPDTALARNAAGVVEVDNGTRGTFRDLTLRHEGGQGAPTANTCAGFALGAGGSDLGGKITLTSGTACSVNFAATFTNAPACVVSPGSAASTTLVTTTTAVMSVTFGTAQTAFSYICIGL